MQQILGGLMVFSVFGGLFIGIAIKDGWKTALGVYAAGTLIVVWIAIGVKLLST